LSKGRFHLQSEAKAGHFWVRASGMLARGVHVSVPARSKLRRASFATPLIPPSKGSVRRGQPSEQYEASASPERSLFVGPPSFARVAFAMGRILCIVKRNACTSYSRVIHMHVFVGVVCVCVCVCVCMCIAVCLFVCVCGVCRQRERVHFFQIHIRPNQLSDSQIVALLSPALPLPWAAYFIQMCIL